MEISRALRRKLLIAIVACILVGVGIFSYTIAPSVIGRITLQTTHNGDKITLRGTLGPSHDGGFHDFRLGPGLSVTLYLPPVVASSGPDDPTNRANQAFLEKAVIDPAHTGLEGRVEIHGTYIRGGNTVYVDEAGDYLKAL